MRRTFDKLKKDVRDSRTSVPDWARFIRNLRLTAGMSQDEFAKAIGIEQSELSLIENGKKRLGLRIL